MNGMYMNIKSSMIVCIYPSNCLAEETLIEVSQTTTNKYVLGDRAEAAKMKKE